MSELDQSSPSAKQIFLIASDLASDEERISYLERVCAENQPLRQQLDAMLKANADADGNPLDRLGEMFGPPLTTTLLHGQGHLSSDVGKMIGPYKLLEQIGQGGFGTVYMAEQAVPLKRKVALKILKPGMESKEVIARFEVERQALAMMDHPQIARVLDGGTTPEGRPFFVMELVRGVPITEYCDEARLPNEERLQLFVEVCQAVQHAHQKGIIHRDLKPSNVLVTMHDDKAVPKVIDFGIAKAVSQPLTDRTLFTGYHQMLGTPMYMSPEQAQMSGIDVDTRSDVYSLGVLLYELLTGTTPFTKESLSKLNFDELRKVIREQDPPRPSARLTTLDAQARSTAADRRRLDQRRVGDAVRGELDWIVMKTLEKDRNRRYESASALAADVRRYLDQEAVEACPPTLGYRLQKVIGRNKGLILAATIVVFSLLLGITASTWLAIEANSARQLADGRLKNEQLALQEKETQRQLAAANLQRAVAVVDQMLDRVNTDEFRSLSGGEPLRKEVVQDGIQFYTAFLEQVPDDPELRWKAADNWARVADLHSTLGELSLAQVARQQAIEIIEVLHAEYPEEARFELRLAQTVTEFGEWEHWRLYRFESSARALHRGVKLWEDLHRRYPDSVEYGSKAAEIEALLASTFAQLNQPDEAEATYRHSIATLRQYWPIHGQPGNEHSRLCYALRQYAFFLFTDRDDKEAGVAMLHEAVERAEDMVAAAPDSIAGQYALADAAVSYAKQLVAIDRTDEAEIALRRAIDIGSKIPRENPLADLRTLQNLWRARHQLGDILIRKGEYAEAESLYLSARRMLLPGIVLPDVGPSFKNEIGGNDNRILALIKKLVQIGQQEQAVNLCQQLDIHEGDRRALIVTKQFAAMAWQAAGDEEKSAGLFEEVQLLRNENPVEEITNGNSME